MKILITFFLLFWGCNALHSQRDTLYVNNFDTIQLNIHEPIYKVVDFGTINSNQKIKLYFHLKCNDTTHTFLSKVYTGDGGCYFNPLSEFDYSLPGLFRNKEFWGEIVYIRKGDFRVNKTINFKFYNKDKGEWELKLKLIGKREE